jgi:hypothetical protein
MRHDVDHYYKVVLGITRRAGEVRPAEFHTFSWYFETQENVFDSAILTCPHLVYGIPFCLYFIGIFFVRLKKKPYVTGSKLLGLLMTNYITRKPIFKLLI